jgi:hypothetical protein
VRRFELKRAQWRDVGEANDAAGGEAAELVALMEGTGIKGAAAAAGTEGGGLAAGDAATPREASTVTQQATGEAATATAAFTPATMTNATKAAMEDEMVVMDAVQEILNKSRCDRLVGQHAARSARREEQEQRPPPTSQVPAPTSILSRPCAL